MKKFNTDREFLQEIEAWLCFNSNPPHEQILELKYNLQNHLSIPIEPPVMQKIAEVIDNEIKSLTRKPTHGPCCTCQECGQHYDDCNCTEIKTLKNIKEKLASNFSA